MTPGPRLPPLLAPWTGPFGGVPPFDRVTLADFEPALEAAMTEQLAAVEAIAREASPATFESTFAAFERSGRTLDRVYAVWGVWASTLSTPEFQAVELAMAPRLAAFQDKITQHEGLFRRLAAAYEARETLCATEEQKRLAWLTYTGFVRSGARLGASDKAEVARINERLATLYTNFTQAILADEETFLLLTDPGDVAGLPASFVASLAEAAASKDKSGWLVANTRSAVEPFLTHASRRDLREKVWRAFVTRGEHPGPTDTRKTLAEILALRSARAKLLGYPTHAHWRIEDSMAKTPERALELMRAVWPAAVARVGEEVADMRALAGAPIEPWDYRFYAEQVRKQRYDLDENEVKPYLQLEKLREAMFWVASQLFDLHFVAASATAIPVYHPDVRVWEVRTGAGAHVGLYYFDPFARPGKQSGAWMNAYRSQERLDGEVTTIVSNNANFVKGAPGEAVLVSWDDATTLFHEFGHALHGLSANATYPSISGTNVPRDYVEFPSQLLERWLATPAVLGRFAVHAVTGEPMPAALLAKLERASRFNQGFATLEYLSAALVDLEAHLAPGPIDASTFEAKTLASLGMPREVVMRHRLPQFSHIFSGDAYSAGYYSYLWADTLSADAFEAFTEAGGAYDRAVAARLREHVFSAGNTRDPAAAYRAFRGRDPGIAALMRKRGFPVPAGTGA